jgi:hypothetical protein
MYLCKYMYMDRSVVHMCICMCIVELLHFSHIRHVSLVQWTYRLLPATGGSSLCPGVQPTLWNWDYLLVPSRYSGDPDMIPDHRPQ